MQIGKQALQASHDSIAFEQLIDTQKGFILRTACKQCGRYISSSDDEWSIALSAFHEATVRFNPSQGSFLPFAAMTINNRLKDFFRKESRHMCEISLAPQAFDGNIDTQDVDCALQVTVVEKIATQPLSAQEEIECANQQFQPFGFSFYDLAECSPRSEKTRKACATAVVSILRTPVLLSELIQRQQLPLQALCACSNVQKKVIERHRRYIIASTLLLTGDYPILSEYLQTIRKELDSCVP